MKLSYGFAELAKGFKWGALLVLILQPMAVFSASSWKMVYVYEKPDGSHLMTSSRLSSSKFQLVKTYKTRKVTSHNKSKKRKNTAIKSKRSICNSPAVQKRAEKYKRSIEVYSRIYGVDEALVHSIMKNESCYRVGAKSPVGAIGLMQLMPQTAKEMKISNPWDPEQNIQGGVKYLSEMLKAFSGDVRLAVAAYNAGPGNVRKHKGVPPFRETRTYVKRVIGDYERMSSRYASR